MKARLVQGIATVGVFGTLVLGIGGGIGTASAASTDLMPQASVSAAPRSAVPAPYVIDRSSALSSVDHASGTLAVVLPGVATAHQPLTKGGKFP